MDACDIYRSIILPIVVVSASIQFARWIVKIDRKFFPSVVFLALPIAGADFISSMVLCHTQFGYSLRTSAGIAVLIMLTSFVFSKLEKMGRSNA